MRRNSVESEQAPARFRTAAELVVLLVGAATAAFIGGSIWWDPGEFYRSYGVTLSDSSLQSELRGAAGVLIGLTAVLLGGVWFPQRRASCAACGMLVYLGYATGRAVGLFTDGPHAQFMEAGIVEAALGLACAWVMWSRSSYRRGDLSPARVGSETAVG